MKAPAAIEPVPGLLALSHMHTFLIQIRSSLNAPQVHLSLSEGRHKSLTPHKRHTTPFCPCLRLIGSLT